jgi:SP family galactose:H+ symporter-like MFS transporter
MPDNKKQGRSNKTMTFFVCFLAALAGLLFGLDIGVIAGALPFIANEFQISAHTQEWVVSSMMFGAAVGAVGSGWLSFKLGRKKSLMIGAILFVAGSLFSAAAPNVEILLVSRVLLGLAVGVASYRPAVSVGNRAGENPRQYDFDVPADDHHRDPRRLSSDTALATAAHGAGCSA